VPITSSSRTGRAVVGRTAAARAAVACRACVAVGRAVIIVVVVVVNIIVRESADPTTTRSHRLKSYPRLKGAAIDRISIAVDRVSIDGGDRWMWALNDTRDRWGIA
jgi:hypothetical protein